MAGDKITIVEKGVHVSGHPFSMRLISLILSIILAANLFAVVCSAAGSEYILNEAMDENQRIGSLEYDGDSLPVYLLVFDGTLYETLKVSSSDSSTYNNVYTSYTDETGCIDINIAYKSSLYKAASDFYDSISFSDTTAQKLNTSLEHILLWLYKDGRGGGPKGYLIVEWKQGASVDKDALNTSISTSEQLNSEQYYSINDRFNGEKYAVEGFWSQMLAALSIAEKIANDEGATQDAGNQATQS